MVRENSWWGLAVLCLQKCRQLVTQKHPLLLQTLKHCCSHCSERRERVTTHSAWAHKTVVNYHNETTITNKKKLPKNREWVLHCAYATFRLCSSSHNVLHHVGRKERLCILGMCAVQPLESLICSTLFMWGFYLKKKGGTFLFFLISCLIAKS